MNALPAFFSFAASFSTNDGRKFRESPIGGHLHPKLVSRLGIKIVEFVP